jgi:hypothetical protein
VAGGGRGSPDQPCRIGAKARGDATTRAVVLAQDGRSALRWLSRLGFILDWVSTDPFVYLAQLTIAVVVVLVLWGLFTRRRRVPTITAFVITIGVALTAAFGAVVVLGLKDLCVYCDTSAAAALSREGNAYREALLLGGWAVANVGLLAGWRWRRLRRVYGGVIYGGDIAIALWAGFAGPSTIDLASVAAMLVAVIVAAATFVAITIRQV